MSCRRGEQASLPPTYWRNTLQNQEHKPRWLLDLCVKVSLPPFLATLRRCLTRTSPSHADDAQASRPLETLHGDSHGIL